MIEGTPNDSVSRPDVLLTREKLAEALDGSLRIVDLMLMRLRRYSCKLVRFYLTDVFRELREKAKTSKRNVAQRV